MATTEKAHVTLIMSRDLYERLNEMRWERRAASFVELLRELLEDCASQHEKRQEKEAELVS